MKDETFIIKKNSRKKNEFKLLICATRNIAAIVSVICRYVVSSSLPELIKDSRPSSTLNTIPLRDFQGNASV